MKEQQDTPALLAPFSRQQSLNNSFWYMGHLFTYLATGDDTDGQFTLTEAVVASGQEPPPHIHTHEDEAFYILEGIATFWVGEQVITATPGKLIFLPRGIPHGFKLQTDTARVLILLTPAGLERYFKAFSTPAQALRLPPPPDQPYDLEKIVGVGREYGIEFLPPPAA